MRLRFSPVPTLLASLLNLGPSCLADTDLRRAVILYTASLQGELTDCGCRDARGGLARRHAYVGRVREESPAPVFLVDVGDSLRRVPPSDPLRREDAVRRDRFLAAMEERLGLDARALGPLDLALGRIRLAELFSAPAPLAANLHPVGEGERSSPSPGFRVISRQGVTLGLVGVAPDDLPAAATPGFRTTPALEAVRRASAAARAGGAEVVVLLSTLGLNRDYRLVDEDLGVDLILGGRSRDLLRRPLVRSGVPIMQAGIRGKAVGRVDLTWGARPLSVRHQVVDLDRELPEDPVVRRAVQGYFAELGPGPARDGAP